MYQRLKHPPLSGVQHIDEKLAQEKCQYLDRAKVVDRLPALLPVESVNRTMHRVEFRPSSPLRPAFSGQRARDSAFLSANALGGTEN
jgi:hypothetical protein